VCTCAQGGGEIIEALCKGSTTFETKTEFAQEKYKRRKARKYLTRLTLRRPTGWTACQVTGREGGQAGRQAGREGGEVEEWGVGCGGEGQAVGEWGMC